SASTGRQQKRFRAGTRAAGPRAAGRPPPLNSPTSMTFAWSGISPGSSAHLAVILVAGFSLLLLANRIVGGRFIRGGPLNVGPVLSHRTVSYGVGRRQERVLILGTSPLADKLIGAIEAHRRSTIVGVVGDEAALCELPFFYFAGGPVEQLGTIVDLVRPHRIIVAPAEGRERVPTPPLLHAPA